MFIFSERGRCEEEEESSSPANNLTYIQRKKELTRVNTSDSMDEFVLL